MCVSYITRYLRCGHKEDQQDVPCARKKRRDGTCPAGVKIEFVDHNTFCPQCLQYVPVSGYKDEVADLAYTRR